MDAWRSVRDWGAMHVALFLRYLLGHLQNGITQSFGKLA